MFWTCFVGTVISGAIAAASGNWFMVMWTIFFGLCAVRSEADRVIQAIEKAK